MIEIVVSLFGQANTSISFRIALNSISLKMLEYSLSKTLFSKSIKIAKCKSELFRVLIQTGAVQIDLNNRRSVLNSSQPEALSVLLSSKLKL